MAPNGMLWKYIDHIYYISYLCLLSSLYGFYKGHNKI